jgi:hypothetical protein
MNPLTLSLAGWLAQSPPTGPKGPEFGGSSPIGLVVTLLLLVALIFLIKSMNKHLRKVPKSFDNPAGNETKPEQADSESNTDAPPRS